MEREIIFRGKRVDNCEWVQGYYAKINTDRSIDVFYHEIFTGEMTSDNNGRVNFKRYIVKTETVGQCSGLKDCNGKLIFEGDVLRRQGCSDVYIVFDKKTASSGWTFTDFIRSQGYIHQLNKYDTSLSEIIGNIHDNPELLVA